MGVCMIPFVPAHILENHALEAVCRFFCCRVPLASAVGLLTVCLANCTLPGTPCASAASKC